MPEQPADEADSKIRLVFEVVAPITSPNTRFGDELTSRILISNRKICKTVKHIKRKSTGVAVFLVRQFLTP
jgi:hypothetical protein